MKKHGKDPRDVLYRLVSKAVCFDYDHRQPWKHIGEMIKRLPDDEKDVIMHLRSDDIKDIRWLK